MSKSTTLPTSLQVALHRASVAAKAAARAQTAAERARRFEPSAYSCRREGRVWYADGPAGNAFQFRPGERTGEVHCLSNSGAEYFLQQSRDGITCDCPDAANGREGGCKHSAGLRAVIASHHRQQSEQSPAKVAA